MIGKQESGRSSMHTVRRIGRCWCQLAAEEAAGMAGAHVSTARLLMGSSNQTTWEQPWACWSAPAAGTRECESCPAAGLLQHQAHCPCEYCKVQA